MICQKYNGWGNSRNFRKSDCVTVRVHYVKMSTVQQVLNTLFLTLDPVLSVLHEHFVSPLEVASLSQQGRTAVVECACEVFSIE